MKRKRQSARAMGGVLFESLSPNQWRRTIALDIGKRELHCKGDARLGEMRRSPEVRSWGISPDR